MDGTPAASTPVLNADADRAGSPGAESRLFRRIFGAAGTVYLVLVFAPILDLFAQGKVFGGDWGQYALTSQLYVTHHYNMLFYPEPALPVLYLPITGLFGTSIATAYAADLLGGFLLVAIYLAAFRLFRTLTGSPWAGLVGALLLGTSPLLLDEVGWAGQAQYLAFVFGLLALGVLFDRVVIDGHERWLPVVGGLLALAALSESYSTLFFLVTIAVWLILSNLRPRTLGRLVRRGIGLFVLPVAALVLLAVANAGLAGQVLSEPLAARAAYAPLYKALYLRFSFDSWILLVLYPSIAVAFVLLWRRLPFAHPSFRWVVPALVIAWVPQFLLLTPVVDTDRSLYFALIGAAAMVAEVAAALPGYWRATVASAPDRVWRTRWGQVPRGRRSIVPILAVIAIVTVGAQAGVSAHTYYRSLTYYGYDTGILTELSMLGSKNGSLLLVTPDLGVFAASWASGRNVYVGPPGQPATYTRSGQQSAVVDGNLLSYGPAWLHAGDTWAIDAEPAWAAPAPLVLQYSGQFLFQALEMNDSSSWVSFSPASAPAVVQTVDLFSAPTIAHADTGSELTTTYEWTGLSVTKSITVDAAGDVVIGMTYDFSSTMPRGAGLLMTLPNPRHTVETTYARDLPSSLKVTQTLKNGFLPFPFPDTVSVAASGFGGTTDFTGPLENGSAGRIVTSLVPTSATPGTLTATITIDPDGMSSVPATGVDERTVLAADGIEWTAVERSMGVPFLERFLNDPTFTLYASTPHYLIFETNWA